MRLPALLLAFVAITVSADEPRKPAAPVPDWRAQQASMTDIMVRAFELQPRRRDTPMRELNITDSEVREIQAIAARYAMHSMLNISPVIAGCPCEEGPLCTDQVYVVAELPGKTVGLELSRVRNAWGVGAVQKWWTRYSELREKFPKMDFRTWMSARNELLLEFPRCTLKDSVAKAEQ
jgi:hypothetical protein